MKNGDRVRVAVVGGGPAGMMAAYAAHDAGAAVTLFEQNDRLGKKLLITGKGRCNVTSDSTVAQLIENITKNPRFLYSAFHAFDTADTMRFFTERGVPLKTERGRRVFPQSDRSADIRDALQRALTGVQRIRAKVTSLSCRNGRITGLEAGGVPYVCERVILATGGVSYPLTGSDGSGFKLAESAGHTVTPLLPSLVPLTSEDPVCRAAQGLALKNVALTVQNEQGAVLYRDFGEMLFTHFGLSGPMILSASAHLHGVSFRQLTALIDLKPALTEEVLDRRLLNDFAKYSNRDLGNVLSGLLPAALIEPFLHKAALPMRKKVHSVTREERRTLLELLKAFPVPLSGTRPIEEAIVTSGGIPVSEIDPKTMMSRLCAGLFFAGEMIDVDAYTGGFNLQIAFSTGFLAGSKAATLPITDER